MMNLKLFTKEERYDLKKCENFKKSNEIWCRYRLNQSISVGSVNYLMKRLFENKTIDEAKQVTFEDWEAFYLKYREEDKKKSGRSKQHLMMVGKRLAEKCKENGIKISKQDAYNYVYIRVLDESFIGFQKELYAATLLQQQYPGFDIVFSEAEDSKYAIDIFVKNGDVVFDAVQVKPISFKRGVIGGNWNCVKAFYENNEKHLQYKEDYGTTPYYLIYNDKNDEFELLYKEDFKKGA